MCISDQSTGQKKALCAFRGWTGRSPGRVWRGPLTYLAGLRIKGQGIRPYFPAGRKPSPPGKVSGPRALTDEGKQPTFPRKTRMNGKHRRAATSRPPTFPWGKVAPRGRKRGGTKSDPAPPHTRQGFALPPSPRRGFFPSSVRAYGPATFPGGEGFLRRGLPNPYFSISMHCRRVCFIPIRHSPAPRMLEMLLKNR